MSSRVWHGLQIEGIVFKIQYRIFGTVLMYYNNEGTKGNHRRSSAENVNILHIVQFVREIP